ncbi:MAG: zinc-dependent metalloprotease, partial [Planctomycetota bacterium]
MRLVAALLVLACFASAESKDPKDSKAPEDPNAQDRKKAEKLLKDAETQKGFLTLHRKEGKVYAELAEADFGRSFLCFESISRGVGRGWVLGGMTLDDLILSFRRISKKTVQVLRQNPRFRADKGSPMERAVSHSFGPSVLASLPVAARHPDRKTVIVDLGPLFLTDMPDVATPLKEAFEQAYKLDAGRSSWGEAKVFPKNVELEVFLSFSASELKDLETVPDSRHVEVGVHYSLYRLPENGYRPRLADDRVGHFLTAVRDFSRPGLSSFVRYVTRWHLQKADPAAAVSPPKDPLVFWIENTVPHRYRRVVRDGILEWNRAFARIGISDAIEVRQMEEDADWDPEDARYNCFRWITSSRLSFGAIGPSRVDPRTGQILDADILYEAENLRGLLWSYQRHHLPRSDAGAPEPYFLAHEAPRPVILRGACDLAVLRVPDLDFARTAFWLRRPGRPVPEEYIVQGLKETVTHEVGHVLGLRHNFKASMIVDLDELDDRERAEREGLFGSVMEYNPPNVARDPERQGYYFTPTLGAYDHWAIEYGYTFEDDRRQALVKEVAQPGKQYATDEDTWGPDPYVA